MNDQQISEVRSMFRTHVKFWLEYPREFKTLAATIDYGFGFSKALQSGFITATNTLINQTCFRGHNSLNTIYKLNVLRSRISNHRYKINQSKRALLELIFFEEIEVMIREKKNQAAEIKRVSRIRL